MSNKRNQRARAYMQAHPGTKLHEALKATAGPQVLPAAAGATSQGCVLVRPFDTVVDGLDGTNYSVRGEVRGRTFVLRAVDREFEVPVSDVLHDQEGVVAVLPDGSYSFDDAFVVEVDVESDGGRSNGAITFLRKGSFKAHLVPGTASSGLDVDIEEFASVFFEPGGALEDVGELVNLSTN